MKIDVAFYKNNGLERLLDLIANATDTHQFVTGLFHSFPSNQFWRFFVDGKKQQKDSWVGFEEREQGFLQGMFNVMLTMLNYIDKPLNVDMLLTYHALATDNVKIKELDEPHRGKWRTADVQFALEKTNVTLEGVLALLHRLEEGDNDFILARDAVSLPEEIELSAYDIINAHTFKYMFDQKMEFVVRRHGRDPNCPQTKKVVIEQLAEFILKSCFFFRTQHEKVYIMADEGDSVKVVSSKEPLIDVVSQKVKHILARYNKLKEIYQKSDQKLFLIAQSIQQLEQLHPFKDANCRVFVMVVLNKLLLENGFPPCMLYDPNCFDAFTPEQLVDEIKKGMLTFQECVINPSKLITLDESKIDSALLAYFKDLQKNAEQRLMSLFLFENNKSSTPAFEVKLASSPSKKSILSASLNTSVDGLTLQDVKNIPTIKFSGI